MTVATFRNAPEADMARGSLESSGIDVFMAGEHVGRLGLHLATIQLQVRRSDEETARELLSQVEF